MINIKENLELNTLNHSCAHLLAHAVKHLYPNALFWVGPVIDDGFYYDMDLGDNVVKEEDLEKIEKEIELKMLEEQVYTDYQKMNELTNKLQEIEKIIEDKMLEWENLNN